jgi:phosphate transporter family protein
VRLLQSTSQKGTGYGGPNDSPRGAVTIAAADVYGLPVSTTHVLSSGVAGTMAANKSGLQMSTVRNLLMAWVPTCRLPSYCQAACTTSLPKFSKGVMHAEPVAGSPSTGAVDPALGSVTPQAQKVNGEGVNGLPPSIIWAYHFFDDGTGQRIDGAAAIAQLERHEGWTWLHFSRRDTQPFQASGQIDPVKADRGMRPSSQLRQHR